ncbi:alpha/beta fold hydrolase [Promicromonospora sp. Populi]|uniref:alpha/beta fold hydrolase n=1 Tax=Promicromonospora sp. Populi TaxID=3239420 RepID=UPI0034E1EDC6
MTVRPRLGAVEFALHDAARPLLVLGPSLGTSVTALWQDAAELLVGDGTGGGGGNGGGGNGGGGNGGGRDDSDGEVGAPVGQLDVIGWDLPGHGTAPDPVPADLVGLTVSDLAVAVLEIVERAQTRRGDAGAPFWYAGVSAGGAVGQQLLLDAPGRVLGAALICTATKFGDASAWAERADLVQRAGTPTQVEGSARRWFGPGFLEREPQVALRLLGSLQTADRFGYAAVCRALAEHDLRGRLGAVGVPAVAIAGGADPATPPEKLEEIADAVPGARLHVLDGVAHLAPAEQPRVVAKLVRDLIAGRVST